MPNWVKNRVEFYSPDKDLLEEICRAVAEEELFSTFCPCPKEVQDQGDEQELAWYAENWGTRWDVCFADAELIEEREFDGKMMGGVLAIFDTPWDPPLGFYARLQEGFPDMEIHAAYEDLGNGCRGIYYNGTQHEEELGEEVTVSFGERVRLKCILDNPASFFSFQGQEPPGFPGKSW